MGLKRNLQVLPPWVFAVRRPLPQLPRLSPTHRYTIARKIRAIFRIEDDTVVTLILRIGLRKDVYE